VSKSGLLALLLLLLILFPSVLFNSTYEEHYEEVNGWFGFGKKAAAGAAVGATAAGAGARTTRPPRFGLLTLVGFCAVGALLYGFLDPSFGFNKGSLALYLGLFAGLVAVALLAELPMVIMLRHPSDRGRIRVLAGSLAVAVVCVAISRLTGFLPGYLYGLIAAAAFTRQLNRDEEGKGVLVATLVLLGASVAAWLLWIPVSNAANEPGASMAILVLDAVLSAIFVCGLEAAVLGLIPLRFLDGHRLFVWRRILWAVVFLVGLFAFVHLLLRPGTNFLGNTKSPVIVVIILFAAFALASVVFWGYFRFRKPREPGAESGGEPAAEPAAE